MPLPVVSVDFNNNSAGTITVVGQFDSTFAYQNHKISFYDQNGSGIKTNGNLWYDNFPPSSSSNSMITSLGSQTIGNRKLYVITLQPNPSNTAEEKVNFYEVQSNGNVELLTSDIGEESYTGSSSYIIDRIAFGYSGTTSSITRWYGVAAWSKLLTLNEISLLSESLLLDSRTKLVSTFPLSSIAPEQGQSLVYSSNEWVPETINKIYRPEFHPDNIVANARVHFIANSLVDLTGNYTLTEVGTVNINQDTCGRSYISPGENSCVEINGAVLNQYERNFTIAYVVDYVSGNAAPHSIFVQTDATPTTYELNHDTHITNNGILQHDHYYPSGNSAASSTNTARVMVV